MLVYIIDGFNLIHKISSLKNSSSCHLDLIHYIKKNRLTGSKNNRVIIIFDGKRNEEAAGEREFEVIFSETRSADEVIKEKMRKIKNKSCVVVISDDREIRDYARTEQVRSSFLSDFIKIKNKKIEQEKNISYSLQREITEQLRKVWGL